MHRRQASHLCQSWLFYIAFLRLKDSGKNKRYYCREGAKILQVHFKTIYSKYSTQWFYLLAVTMDSGFSKKIKPWIFFLSLFKLFWLKYILNWIKFINKIKIAILYKMHVKAASRNQSIFYLQTLLLRSFFQLFIVLGMYNFGPLITFCNPTYYIFFKVPV